MTADTFVRAARAGDAADLTRVQVASWRSAYANLIPDAVLAELTSAQAQRRWREKWRGSVANPPTSRHRVLVAVETAGKVRTVAGFTSFGPATDPDLWPGTDAELYELCVDPQRSGRGHGSRLLNAVADTVAGDGFQTLCAWTLESGSPLRGFLESAGWAPDGTRRELDMGIPVAQLRLHTAIGLSGGDEAWPRQGTG